MSLKLQPIIRFIRLFSLMTIILSIAGIAVANDSSAALSTGGIVLEENENIVLITENLLLSPSKVRVEYEYLNESTSAETLLVAFALPKLDKLDDQINWPRPSYLNFKTWVDGKEIKLVEGYKYWELEEQTQKLLSNLGNKTDYYLVLRQQTFPENKITQVVHEYTPAVGGGIPYYNYKEMRTALAKIQEDETNRNEHGYWLNCTDADDALKNLDDWVARMQKKEGLDPLDEENYWQYLIWFDKLSYILTTGNNWNGPIRNFNLKVTADRPFFLNTCFEGLERTSETSYEFNATDYSPRKNIYLMFHMSIDTDQFKLFE